MTKGDADVVAARCAYGAYFLEAKGHSLVTGDQLPPWGKLGLAVQYAWIAAARAARDCTAVDPVDE